MDTARKRKIVLWSLWMVTVPPGLYFVYQSFPPPEMNAGTVAAYLAFYILACLLPMNINGVPTYLVQWLTVAVFLKFGLFAEIILSQITVLIVILRLRTSEKPSIRIPFNSMMFFAVSCMAGFSYLAAGGQIGSLDLSHVILYGLIFQIVSIVTNQLILYFYIKTLGVNINFFSIDTIWDFAITLVVFPYAIALYISEAYIGLPALLLLGIPFFIVTAVMKMYNNSEKVNMDLKKAGNIGHQLAARLSTEEVLDQFVIQVAELFKVDYAYVIDYREEELQMLRMFENNEFSNSEVEPVRNNKGIAGKVVIDNKPFIYDKKAQWKDIVSGYMPEDAESLMATPLSRNDKIEGVLVLASKKQHAFVHHQLQILDILGTYFAVSLEKAVLVQNAISKSERCGLTKLYNYRYLNESLEKYMEIVNKGELKNLSLVMMDIDHFKGINDRYGHQSGNDILEQLARMLKQVVGNEGTIARYGGEEFVILLPNYSKDLALLFAEELRRRIENHDFEIDSDLDDERGKKNVNVTMSIGVSTAPEDSDDSMALIRNADRALYIGAKQAGRNKVAAYTK